jgi:hypothetical protein
MKKFVVLLIVLALTSISTSAFATHEEESTQPGIVKSEPGVTAGTALTFSGSIDIRERFYNLGVADTTGVLTNSLGIGSHPVPARTTNTQERVRFNVDAKVGDYLNGRISFENDWDTFGRVEQPQGNGATSTSNSGRIDLREAWMNFMIPGVPVGVKVGHQLLQLGNGWFFRSMKYGSDAWVVYNGTGNNTLAFYDVRVGENVGTNGQPDQDTDFYGVLDAYKLADGVISIDLTWASVPSGGLGQPGALPLPGKTNDYNLGLSYAGKTGPVHLKLEVDAQTGKADGVDLVNGPGVGNSMKFKGYQAILQGAVPMDPLTIDFTLAYGSGNKLNSSSGPGDKDFKQLFNVLDNDQHYTLIYEYLEPTAGTNAMNLATGNESLHSGFANTMAANLGLMFDVSKKLAVGFEYWYLQAVEDVAINGNATTSNKLGNEVDFKLNWKLYDNLTWNWQVGWFKHGDAYKKADGSDPEDSTAVLGMLSFKF